MLQVTYKAIEKQLLYQHRVSCATGPDAYDNTKLNLAPTWVPSFIFL